MPATFFKQFKDAFWATLPLSIAVTPWGILCGTLGVKFGLSPWQSQLMSLAVFAGAAQISALYMFSAGTTWLALINSTAMISVRHVLYSASYRENVIEQPFYKRAFFAFILTDEMFAIAQDKQAKTGVFDYQYAVISGSIFYIIWNCATFAGILGADALKNVGDLGFDFAIAATFIAMVVPMLKSTLTDHFKEHSLIKGAIKSPMLVAVLISVVTAFLFKSLGWSQWLILSSVLGMGVGTWLSVITNQTDTGMDKCE